MLEDEEQLRQLVERVVAMAELRPMSVLREDAIAQAVDGRGERHRRPAFRKLNASCADKMRWSTTRTPTASAASTTARVRTLSCSVGATVPFGWLWARTTPNAPRRGFDHKPRVDGCTIDGPFFQRLDAVAQKPVAGIERDQILGRQLHAGAGDRERQEQLDNLVVREAVQAGLQEAIAQPLPVAVIVRLVIAPVR